MRNKCIFSFATLMLFTLCIISCTKPAGEGGTSKIKGKIFIRDYNGNFTILNASYYGIEERVYIIYGDETFYGDDVRTSYDGGYEFNYLRKGTYKVFAYSKDSTLSTPGELFPVIESIEITDDYQTVEVPLIILLN